MSSPPSPSLAEMHYEGRFMPGGDLYEEFMHPFGGSDCDDDGPDAQDGEPWYWKAGDEDPIGHSTRFRAMCLGNFRLFDMNNDAEVTRAEDVSDRHTVRWSDEDGVERSVYVKIYDLESVANHADMFKGPHHPSFCAVDASHTWDGQPHVDENCLWSVGVLRRFYGTCGSEKWDAALSQIEQTLRA